MIVSIVIALEGLSWFLHRSKAFARVASTSWNLINPDVLISLVQILTVIGTCWVLAKVSPRTLGIDARRIPLAIAAVCAIWGLVQLAEATVALTRYESLAIYPGWGNPRGMLTPLIERMIGSVIAEELIWRGLVLTWCLDYFERRRPIRDPFIRTGSALLISQSAYAIAEIIDATAARGRLGLQSLDFPLLAVSGVFFALLYLRTRNLWLVMGVHLLTIWPAPLLSSPIDPAKLTVALAAVLLVPDPSRPISDSRSVRLRPRAPLTREHPD